MANSSSFFSRAAGTVVNPLSKAMGSMREVLEHHTGESGEQKLLENMLQLFVIVLRADGAISAMEQQSVVTLVRDTYGEAASSKLQQILHYRTALRSASFRTLGKPIQLDCRAEQLSSYLEDGDTNLVMEFIYTHISYYIYIYIYIYVCI